MSKRKRKYHPKTYILLKEAAQVARTLEHEKGLWYTDADGRTTADPLEATACCCGGALRIAKARLDGTTSKGNWTHASRAAFDLVEGLAPGGRGFVHYNDLPNTTKGDIVALLDLAVETACPTTLTNDGDTNHE